MDNKLQYNVWMRDGNRYAPVLNTPVSQATAEALAMLMAAERHSAPEDSRFCVSASKPCSGGFPTGEHAVGGYVIDYIADKVLRECVSFRRSVGDSDLGQTRWHLLQAAGLVNHKGHATEAGRVYCDTRTKLPKP